MKTLLALLAMGMLTTYANAQTMNEKITIYQLLPRTFGNTKGTNVYNGNIAQNGCGKMNDLTAEKLQRIHDYGFSHIWYTGLLEHATQTDYTAFGIRQDNPAVVKGKAGSPYAVKDYYDIDPDLAVSVPNRMQEFEALLARTHAAGLKMIMDFIPNHVARQYYSDARPKGVRDLGEDDDTTQAFNVHNNFYYLPGEKLHTDHFAPEQAYDEAPAKATGNDRFDAWPDRNDWYETVKLNYGIDYLNGRTTHFPVSPTDSISSTWRKMTDILLFWANKGVDAFRCDMAEMVPVEFWKFATREVKATYPHIRFIAEVYNPNEYRNYLHQGGFDYLYNKVGLYDTLKAVTRYEASAQAITHCWQAVDDIRDQMLNFLENHDEQRIASDFFDGDPRKAQPAFVVSALMDKAAVMIYAGQELGERGMDDEGFSGRDGRTTIFDYWSVASLRRWHEGEATFTADEKRLYDFYRSLLSICRKEKAVSEGAFYDLMHANLARTNNFNPDRQYAFLRKKDKETLLIIVNFDNEPKHVGVVIPQNAFDYLDLHVATKSAIDLLTGNTQTLTLRPEQAVFAQLPAYGATILKF